MSRRRVAAVIAVAALGAAVFVLRPGHKAAPPAAPVVVASAPAEAPAPYAARAEYPRAEAPKPQPEAEPVAEEPAREAPPPPKAIHLGPPEAPAVPAEPTTLATLYVDYRDAVCACATRTCVRQLQGKFIRRLSTASYDRTRDGEAKERASREATRCLHALPESS